MQDDPLAGMLSRTRCHAFADDDLHGRYDHLDLAPKFRFCREPTWIVAELGRDVVARGRGATVIREGCGR